MAEEAQEEKKESGGGKGLIIILLVVMILLIIGIGVMAFLMLSANKDGGKDDAAETTEQHASADHAEAPAEGYDDGVVRQYSPKFKQYEPPEPGAAPQYFAMEPFVVNFKGEGQAKFLAVTLKFMTHYPQLVTDMEAYRPILRNDITNLLRVQRFSVMDQDDGPDVLREKILNKARGVLEKRGIYPDLLEDVYFERFVMQ